MARDTLGSSKNSPSITTLLRRWVALLVAIATVGCASGDPLGEASPSPVASEAAAVTTGGECAEIPADYIGVGDGCDCPASGDVSCDPDCAQGNPGGAYCGCQYCYPEEEVPPSGTSCDYVPHEYVGVHDGCDCPSDGSTQCDPDCAEGNIADDYCGCQFCYSGDGNLPPPPDPFAVDLPNRMTPDMVTVFAKNTVNIGSDAQVRRGTRGLGRVVNMGSAGTTTFGARSKVGEVWSACSVSVGNTAEVGGSVYTPGTVTKGTGVIMPEDVEKVPTLPDPRTHTFNPQMPARTGGDKSVSTSTTLSPGGYGNVTINAGGTLRFGPGVYHVGNLTVATNGKIMIDDATGPVVIYVDGAVQFDGTIVNTNNQANPNLRVLIVVTGPGVVRLGGFFTGSIYAPRSSVSLTKPGQPGYYGTYFGNDVTLSPGVFVYHVGYPWSAVKPDAPLGWRDSTIHLGAYFDHATNQSHPQETTLGSATEFTIPAVLSVRNGNAGTGTARLKFRLGSAAITTCTFKGAAGVAHPTTPAQITRGLIYEFQSCNDGKVAGQRVKIDWVSLEVLGGDASAPAKQTEVELDSNDGCSGSVPPPLHPWEVVDLKASFSWKTAKALPETDPDGRPALWHGLIYIDDKVQLAALDRLRIFWSARPLSATYTEQMRGLCGRVEHATDGTGVVVYAVFPAKIFNLIRAVSIRAVLENVVPPFAFIIPSAPEAEYANSDGSLRYDALASTGFHTWLAERSALSPGFWSKISKPFKHAAKWVKDNLIDPVTSAGATVFHYTLGSIDEFIDTLVPLIDDIWETAQEIMGGIAFAIEPDVGLHLNIRLQNLDPHFLDQSWLVRTWGPKCTPTQTVAGQCGGENATSGTRPILLPTGTKFRIRQWGFGFLPVMKEKTLHDDGVIDIRALKNRTGRGGDFCVQLEADYGMMTTDIIPNEVCDFATNHYGNFEHDINDTLLIRHDDLHTFAQVKDGYDYNFQVLKRDSFPADILTGWPANTMTSIVNGDPRAMTLCLDFPGMGQSLLMIAGGVLGVVGGTIADKIYSKDIWWPDAVSARPARNSRVMTHEYGHFTMCDLLYHADGPLGLQGLLARPLETNKEVSRGDEAGVMTEMIADTYALQVAGGTNYAGSQNSILTTTPPGGVPVEAEMKYCTGALCFDYNYQGIGDSQRISATKPLTDYKDEIARWVSTTYDAFDQVGSASHATTSAVSNCDYWTPSGGRLVTSPTGYLGRDDEPVTLSGQEWQKWVEKWLAHGRTPSIGNVVAGLFDTVKIRHNWCDACELLASHHPAASATLTMNGGGTRNAALQVQRYEFCEAHPETFNWLGTPPRADGRFDTRCFACAASQYQDPTTGQCVSCPAGNIATLHGCSACAPGSIPTANNDCRRCAANQISSGNTCVTCPFGQSADAATNTCVFCEPDVVVDWAGTGLCSQSQTFTVGVNGVSGDHCPNDGWVEVRNIASGPYGSAYNSFKVENLFTPDITSQSLCTASSSTLKVNHRSGSSLITDLTSSGIGAWQGACDTFICPPIQCTLPAVSALTKTQVTNAGNTLKILVNAARNSTPIGVGVKLTLAPTTPATTCGPR